MNEELCFRWARDSDDINQVVDLFIANAPVEYISHGEIQDGRASSIGVWSDGLESIIRRQFAAASRREKDDRYSETRLALVQCPDGAISGFSYIGINRSGLNAYAVLYDVLVDKRFREKGVGTILVNWIIKELGQENIGALFLESGLKNTRAHEFFKHLGFDTVSITMMKMI